MNYYWFTFRIGTGRYYEIDHTVNSPTRAVNSINHLILQYDDVTSEFKVFVNLEVG